METSPVIPMEAGYFAANQMDAHLALNANWRVRGDSLPGSACLPYLLSYLLFLRTQGCVRRRAFARLTLCQFLTCQLLPKWADGCVHIKLATRNAPLFHGQLLYLVTMFRLRQNLLQQDDVYNGVENPTCEQDPLICWCLFGGKGQR